MEDEKESAMAHGSTTGSYARLPRPSSTSSTTAIEQSDDPAVDASSPLLAPLLESSHSSASSRHSYDGRKRVCNMKQFTTQGVIVLLCCINLMNYIDRGIIPGAPEKFENFITQTLHVEVTQQSVYLGLLTSAFIASYAVCSMLFGYLALTHRPFRLISIGMSVWVIAVVICGVAQYADSYYVLIFGRLVSGVGEASFQCTAVPFINTHASKKNRALVMGIFLASITVGTAVGYIYGSIFASSSLGWAGGYFLEGLVMIGLILCCLFLVPDELDCVPTHDKVKNVDLTSDLLEIDAEVAEAKLSMLSDDHILQPKQSFLVEWWGIFSHLPFLFVILGHAAYTFSLAALSVFCPVIFIGLGLFSNETQASLIFGALVAVTGTLGTPMGGILIDRMTKRDAVSSEQRCYLSVASLFFYIVAAEVFGLIMLAFVSTKALLLLFMTLCLFCLCALTPSETIAVMEMFPESRRSMAIAANTLVIHALGDVPSPIIIGWLKDSWAPHCGTVVIDGEAKLNPDCHLDQNGLREVLLFALLWMLWGVFFWGLTTLMLRKQKKRQEARATAAAHP